MVLNLIYFVSIIDVSEGGGVPKWDFIHPDTPHPLRERLEKYRELAASFVYGIITAFGGEIVGDRVRELRLSEIQTIFMRMKHKGSIYYVVFIVDIRDNPKAVYRAFMRFYRKYYNDFDEILTSIAVSTATIERLRTAMSKFLVPYARTNRTFGARDRTHLIASYCVSLIVTSILAIAVWLINNQYSLKEQNTVLFAGLVFLLLFFVPALPIGILTQYRKLAFIVGYLDSLSIVLGAAVLWHEMLTSSAESLIGMHATTLVVVSAAALIGLMLGTVLAFAALIVAWFFETRKLTSIRPLKLIPEEPITTEGKREAKEEIPSLEEISTQITEESLEETSGKIEVSETEKKIEESTGEVSAPNIDMSDLGIE